MERSFARACKKGGLRRPDLLERRVLKGQLVLLLAINGEFRRTPSYPSESTVIWSRGSLSNWKGQEASSLAPIRLMISKPFDFKKYPCRDFKVPSWFKHYLPPSGEEFAAAEGTPIPTGKGGQAT